MRRALLACVCLVVASCSSGDEVVTIGRLRGEIGFRQPSAAVIARLATAGPAASPADAVRLFAPGASDVVASAAYAVDADLLAPTVRLARYDLRAPASEADPSYLAEVQWMTFADGSTYRFGSPRLDSPHRLGCDPVAPEADRPEGVACDLRECAAVARVRVRLRGAQADLDALSDLACGVEVLVDEVPSTGAWAPQARAARGLLDLDEAADEGVPVELLVRADVPHRVRVGCLAGLEDGESGFPLDQDTGRATFSGEAELSAAACGGGPATTTVDVPVERTAGSMTGLFDLGGYGESAAWIHALWSPFRSTDPPRFAAGDAPTRADPADAWRLDQVVPVPYIVEARAAVDGDRTVLQLPWRGARNGLVEVPPLQTVDLGATFVARPIRARGTLTLLDPNAVAGLDELRFGTLPLDVGDGTPVARAVAEGDLLQSPGGISGEGGRSWGALARPSGSAPGAPVAGLPLEYELLFAGLSPVDGATDGSDALAAPWSVRGADLALDDGLGNRQQVRYRTTRALSFRSSDPDPIDVPELSVCMGRVELELHAPPSLGTLFDPRFSTGWHVSTPAFVGAPAHEASLSASGAPRDEADAADVATVHAAAPDGVRYRLDPRYRLRAGGTSTDLRADPIDVPASGTLGCGGVAQACLVVADDAGEAQALSVGVERDRDCAAGTDGFVVSVDSDGTDVDLVRYEIDPPSAAGPQIACQPCAAGPVTIDVGDLPPGPHVLVVQVVSANGCSARVEQPFEAGPCPLPVSPRDQLAIATDAGVEVRRLLDGDVLYTVNAADAHHLAYDPTGERIALLRAGSVRVVDAADGSPRITLPGRFVDLAFAPARPDLLALVERTPGGGPGGPFRLVLYDETADRTLASDPVVALPGATASAPTLAWSPDGRRVALFFDTVATASDGSWVESRLFVPTWEVADDLAAAGDDLLGPPDVPADFTRTGTERSLDVAWSGPQTLNVATTSGLYLVGADLILRDQRPDSLVAAELGVFGSAFAAIVTDEPGRLGVLTDVAYLEGPPASPKPSALAVGYRPPRVALGDQHAVQVLRLVVDGATPSLAPELTLAKDARALALRPGP